MNSLIPSCKNVAENMCFETGAELKEDDSILYTAEPDGESLSPEQIESILTSDNPRETLYKILDEASLGNDDFLWDAAAQGHHAPQRWREGISTICLCDWGGLLRWCLGCKSYAREGHAEKRKKQDAERALQIIMEVDSYG